MNHQDPYLVTVFGFMGIADITFIHVEDDKSGGQKLAESIANAHHKITELVAAQRSKH